MNNSQQLTDKNVIEINKIVCSNKNRILSIRITWRGSRDTDQCQRLKFIKFIITTMRLRQNKWSGEGNLNENANERTHSTARHSKQPLTYNGSFFYRIVVSYIHIVPQAVVYSLAGGTLQKRMPVTKQITTYIIHLTVSIPLSGNWTPTWHSSNTQ